jgi:hypothetical protein
MCQTSDSSGQEFGKETIMLDPVAARHLRAALEELDRLLVTREGDQASHALLRVLRSLQALRRRTG